MASSSEAGQPQVGWINVGMGAMTVAVTIAISILLGLGIEIPLFIAVVRAVVQLTVMATILTLVFDAESFWAVLLMSIVMLLLGANEVTFSRPKRRPQGLFLSSLISLACSVLSLAAFTGRCVIVHHPWWSPSSFIPILGMITGNAISGIEVANNVIMKELIDNRNQVNTYLAFGGSRFQVAVPIAREALRLALLPSINQMSVAGLISIPGMMTGAILGGADATQAAQLQMIILFLISATSTFCVFISIASTLSTLLDADQRIRSDRVSSVKQTPTTLFKELWNRLSSCCGLRKGKISLPDESSSL